MDKEKLLKDLQIAKEQALTHKNDNDNGTCNFDTPLIKLEGTTEQELQDLVGKEYGVSKYNGDWYQIGFKVLQGQAHKRTMMALKFVGALQELGYKSFVQYVID